MRSKKADLSNMSTARLESKLSDLKYAWGKGAWFDRTGYEPHLAQFEVHRSDARFIVAICGRRMGKSMLASKEIEHVVTEPDKRIWIVAPTYDLTNKVFREVWQTFVVGHKCIDVAKKSEYERYIRLKNGSEIIGKSADNPDSLIGEGVDYLVFDEAAKCKQSVWEKYLRPTLSDREGRALFITTPEGQNWVYRLFMRGKSIGHPDWASFHFPTSANPYIKPAEIKEAKDTLTDETFRQEYLAEFTTYAGKVYKNFDPAINVTDDMPAKFEKMFTAADYGFVNETAILVIGVDDGRFYVLDEVYKTGLNEGDTVLCYNELIRQYPQISKGYGDHDQSKLSALRRAGHSVIRALKNSVADGIQTVSEQLKLMGDGRPRLFISTRCKNLIMEMESYRYADKKGRSNLKEEPLKLKDHAVDALRYGLYTYLKGFKPASIKGDKIF